MIALELRERVAGLIGLARDDLADLVAVRSVADSRPAASKEGLRAAEWVCDALREEGFADARLLETPNGAKTVFASRAAEVPGAPVVLLYARYDVHPVGDETAWRTPPFELTEVDGRWYGRGAADGKGNLMMHLSAVRALGRGVPVNLKVVVEGSAEPGGLAGAMGQYAQLLAADAIIVGDAGNLAVGVPAITLSMRGSVTATVTVQTLASAVEAARFAGPAPDPLAALIQILSTFRDQAGNTTVMGLDNMTSWAGALYPPARFREDAGVLDGVSLLGHGAVADSLWARPALTVLGIDCPEPGRRAVIQPWARARLDLRVPPHTDITKAARALIGHLNAVAPWGVHVKVERETAVAPFLTRTAGPAYAAMAAAMHDVYGEEPAALGRASAGPLCSALAETFPEAEIILVGVAEPQAQTRAPNESVDPAEMASMALAEALFLQRYARVR